MACTTCGTGGGCGSAGGCQNKGLCASGSCNKMNSYDWITTLDLEDPSAYEYVEVSFKNGARKEFYKNPHHLTTGDAVLVEVQGGGYDIGTISLSGDLVRLQLKKKFTTEDRVALTVLRRANDRDLEKLENKITLERDSMILARAIAQSLSLDIKIGDVEYQGDMKKATFFFTANGRVDFRELVRSYAKEFKVKIEMRQIGSRQESARIGGIGSCGRELCCSTWLSDFRSVNTTVARYQNLAINQTKLSGQCGRLKCCLNYELDSYMDALKHFPTHAHTIKTKKGNASLVKTDIFKGLMFYVYEDITMRGIFHPLEKEKVKIILEMNKKGVMPEDLTTFAEAKEVEIGFADVTGEIELPNRKPKKKKKKPLQGQGPRPANNVSDSPSENRGPRPERGPREDRGPRQDRGPRDERPREDRKNTRENAASETPVNPSSDSPTPQQKDNNNKGPRPQNQGPRNDNRRNQNGPNPNQREPNQQREQQTRKPEGNQVSDINPPMPSSGDEVKPQGDNITPGGENTNNQNPNRNKKRFFNKNRNKNKS
jgi:cell fate regulator YaaT (PSP1 superfamily)